MPASRSGSHGACHGRALGWQRVHIGRGPQAQNVGCRRGRRVVRSLGCWPWRPNGSWRGRPPGRDVAVGTRSPAQPVGCCAPEARPMIREGTCRGGSDASAPARGPNRVRQGLLDSHPTRRPPRGPLRGRLAGDSLDATTRAARLGQERGQQHRRAVLLAAMAPTLAEAIDVARGKAFVILDGTLLRVDRVGMTGGRGRPSARGNLWVPRTLSCHATGTYSWMRPPSRSLRNGRMFASEGGIVRPAGGRWSSDRCGRWAL